MPPAKLRAAWVSQELVNGKAKAKSCSKMDVKLAKMMDNVLSIDIRLPGERPDDAEDSKEAIRGQLTWRELTGLDDGQLDHHSPDTEVDPRNDQYQGVRGPF